MAIFGQNGAGRSIFGLSAGLFWPVGRFSAFWSKIDQEPAVFGRFLAKFGQIRCLTKKRCCSRFGRFWHQKALLQTGRTGLQQRFRALAPLAGARGAGDRAVATLFDAFCDRPAATLFGPFSWFFTKRRQGGAIFDTQSLTNMIFYVRHRRAERDQFVSVGRAAGATDVHFLGVVGLAAESGPLFRGRRFLHTGAETGVSATVTEKSQIYTRGAKVTLLDAQRPFKGQAAATLFWPKQAKNLPNLASLKSFSQKALTLSRF